jgi:hypothetical protein
MPAIKPPAAMVETPTPLVLTAAGPRGKRDFGASAVPTGVASASGAGGRWRGSTEAALFALIGAGTARRRAPGQRIGFILPLTAGDFDAR